MKKLLTILLLTISSISFAVEPINIVVPVSPGGNVDMFARTLSKTLQDSNIPNVLIYQTGASGDIALNYTLNKKNNTILLGGFGNFVLSHVFQNRDNFHATSMTIISPIVEVPPAFLTSNTGFTTLKQLVDYAKVSPLPCGVSSANTLELLKINKEYGTNFEPVQYRGTAQLKLDLLSNNIKCGYDGTGAYMQEHKGQYLKILATVREISPEIPLISSVLPKYNFISWIGVAIPEDSNLLDNKELLFVLHNFGKYEQAIEKLKANAILLAKPDNNINTKMIAQTKLYKAYIK